ncbi:MAG: hypothetical protein SGBAC_002223 [Bacillariaceae sp.]
MEDSDKGLFDRFDDDDDDEDDLQLDDDNNNDAKYSTMEVSSSSISRDPPAKAVALSMRFMKSLSGGSGLCCQDCDVGFKDEELKLLLNNNNNNNNNNDNNTNHDNSGNNNNGHDIPSDLYNLQSLQRQNISSISPLVSAPMMMSGDGSGMPNPPPTTTTSDISSGSGSSITIEKLIGEYMTLCQFYKVPYNSGVLCTLRYRLPSLRVGNSFHDTDMLALTELLLRHANFHLSYIRRLDFTIPGKEGKRYRSMKFGFTSHGALALAKTLQYTKYVTQVWLPKHRIGPYGASALFWACSSNPSIEQLNLRRCRIGERGAFAFCELILKNDKTKTRLQDVDLSANAMGHRGTSAIENAVKKEDAAIYVNLEGNLVIPEHTKYIFMVLDKCAIYILIAGSYTPFMQILFYDKPIWSSGLLSFIWLCGLLGIAVEAFAPTWERRKHFSLAMYLGMGWAAMACMPQMYERLPRTAMNMLVMGGVGYTAGVPFFVRNNNMDHAIWHLFVMAGSIFHWLCVYFYVAPLPLHGYEETLVMK